MSAMENVCTYNWLTDDGTLTAQAMLMTEKNFELNIASKYFQTYFYESGYATTNGLVS